MTTNNFQVTFPTILEKHWRLRIWRQIKSDFLEKHDLENEIGRYLKGFWHFFDYQDSNTGIELIVFEIHLSLKKETFHRPPGEKVKPLVME